LTVIATIENSGITDSSRGKHSSSALALVSKWYSEQWKSSVSPTETSDTIPSLRSPFSCAEIFLNEYRLIVRIVRSLVAPSVA